MNWPADRLDLGVRAGFFSAVLQGYDEALWERMYLDYLHHRLKGGRSKDGRAPQDYLLTSRELLASLQRNGYDQAHPVRLGHDGRLIDGAHRWSAATALGIETEMEKSSDKCGVSCGRGWFDAHLSCRDYRLRLLHAWVRHQPQAAMLVVWAPALSQLNEITGRVSRDLDIVDIATIRLPRPGFESLVYDVYGLSKLRRMIGVVGKKVQVLADYPPELAVIVAQGDPYANARSIRDELRAELDVGVDAYATLHTPNSRRETTYLADILLSPANLRHVEMRRKVLPSESLLGLIERARCALEQRGIDPLSVCVVGGSVLDACDLRPAHDIDLAVPDPQRESVGIKWGQIVEGVDLVSRQYHRGVEAPYPDEGLACSPEAHFVRLGLKFATLDIVRSTKAAHGRKKDLVDVAHIDGLT